MVVAQRIEQADPNEIFFPRLLDSFFDVASFTVESLIQGQHCEAVAKMTPGFFSDMRNVKIVASDCLQGLKLLETVGVVHNDMKADNLLWCKGSDAQTRGSVKIVDFWSARLDRREEPIRNWDLAEGGQGHLGKWPPEMILRLPISHVADLQIHQVDLRERLEKCVCVRCENCTSKHVLEDTAQFWKTCSPSIGSAMPCRILVTKKCWTTDIKNHVT